MPAPVVLVLGASGLIGHALTLDLQGRGLAVRGVARKFFTAQTARLTEAVEAPVLRMDRAALAQLLADADIIVNCIGVLQDVPGNSTDSVHRAFAVRLAAICAAAPGKLLIHLSVPGAPEDDNTNFSRSKRQAEQAIMESGTPFVILRPGFVIAPAAYGGSALFRALAASPFGLSARERAAPFAATAMTDICATIAQLVARWRRGETAWRKCWDVMEDRPGTVNDMLQAFRAHFGNSGRYLSLPGWLLRLGAWAGDTVSWLGWRPPVRSTAIRELRRGVTGQPAHWMADTGITPLSAAQALSLLPATVQETWFARLYLLKAVALVTLVIFWCSSGLIALTMAFAPARAILLAHGFAFPLAQFVTIASSLMDILVGCAIAMRATCRAGLIAGIAVSLFYMTGAALITPDLWGEPLGALVKTGPAIILMLFCLAIWDDR